MPNCPNPLFSLTTEHLIFLIFNGIYYYFELRKNTEKKQSSLKYDVKTNSGPYFQSTRLFPHSQ